MTPSAVHRLAGERQNPRRRTMYCLTGADDFAPARRWSVAGLVRVVVVRPSFVVFGFAAVTARFDFVER